MLLMLLLLPNINKFVVNFLPSSVDFDRPHVIAGGRGDRMDTGRNMDGPEIGKEYKVFVGESIKPVVWNNNDDSKFHRIHFNFLPSSVDFDRPHVIAGGRGENYTIQLQNENGGLAGTFSGPYKEPDNECVLLFNGENFRIEKINYTASGLSTVEEDMLGLMSTLSGKNFDSSSEDSQMNDMIFNNSMDELEPSNAQYGGIIDDLGEYPMINSDTMDNGFGNGFTDLIGLEDDPMVIEEPTSEPVEDSLPDNDTTTSSEESEESSSSSSSSSSTWEQSDG
eukprot:TRINITY_DN2625_c1_g3_i1.p1 TRINITY_DN2625_c1_g3~~TRINITY_DN2625_c1_g3_i1.p1  ORF type:complete len:280 (+),score=91.33 TRINITY_DN2625_c1_g3_i1:391-1230(+)